MKSLLASPTVRLSFGLISLVVSLTLAAEFFGFLPDKTKLQLDARTQIVETLAVQLSWGAARNDTRMIQTTLESVVGRNDDVLSAALRTQRSGLIAEAGDHEKFWLEQDDGQSTAAHIQVPIMRNQQQWGVVELSFAPLQGYSTLTDWKESQYGFLAFITLTGFIFFLLFLRRALKELDPSSVVPERVKAAFDALAEGVIIMDEKEQIVLANQAFSDMVGHDNTYLIGRVASDLEWRSPDSGDKIRDLPWHAAIFDGNAQMGVPLSISSDSEKPRMLVVNGAPILDGKGRTRGALATFDDVSDLEKKNNELQFTLNRLEKSREKVKKQNKELTFLATRDPLTGCLNRRATFEGFDVLFEKSRETGAELTCIMIDIDHFKSINDKYGHSAGDKVIKFVAKTLRLSAREQDLVSRYGGEEFLLILPGLDLDAAARVAERLRTSIQHDFHDKFTASRDLTVSLGVAAYGPELATSTDLVNCADKALYAAKNSGRNKVIRWDDPSVSQQVPVAGDLAEGSAAETMLIEKLHDATQTMQLQVLNDRVIALDAMIEEKSVKLHRKHGFDELTGLPNRILFYDRATQALAAAQRDDKLMAMLYLDVDLFRRVKDTLGPVVEENLILAATERVASVLRESDSITMVSHGEEAMTLSQLGTNEFGIALTDLDSTESITWILQRLFDALSKPIKVGDDEVYANCAVGVSIYPEDGNDVETLVRYASTARHHAQASLGRHKYMFYAQDMNERSFQQMRLESQMREAISRGEFELYFQPAFDVQTGQVQMLETLIRWNHPQMGLLGPDMFIPIAEHTGYINDIGDWVLRSACEQMKHWVSKGLSDSVRVAVNLSAVQVRSEGLVENILNIVKEVGLDTKYLELEITETALMENIEATNEMFQELRSHGIKIAIDDFGTGYSSLSHLKYLNVDSLKIDRSFVRDVNDDPRDAAVVGAIIAMAKQMGLDVVAEGVETEEQLEFLRQRQCGSAQGYLLARPSGALDTSVLLATDVQEGIAAIKAHAKLICKEPPVTTSAEDVSTELTEEREPVSPLLD